MAGNEISIIPSELRQTAENIRQNIATPFANDMNTFYEQLNDFVSRSYVTNASRQKEKQIEAKRELLQRMYNVMNEYAAFLDNVANKFIKADAENVSNFTDY